MRGVFGVFFLGSLDRLGRGETLGSKRVLLAEEMELSETVEELLLVISDVERMGSVADLIMVLTWFVLLLLLTTADRL